MMSHQQHLRNPQYKNWVKATLALKYLKDGIEEFVDDELRSQQKSILEKVRNEIGRSDATCNQCSIDKLLPYHDRASCDLGSRCFCHDQKRTRRPCPNDICGRIFDRIVKHHMYRRPSWRNTDSTKWCTSHWEIGNCFIEGGGYEKTASALDTDCKGLLSIVTNDMYIQKNIDTPIDKIEPRTDAFSKSKEARNEILHNGSLQLPEGKLKDYVEVMIKLLEYNPKILQYQQANQAVSKLKKLKETDLYISIDEDIYTREIVLKAIQEKNQEALYEINKKQQEIVDYRPIGELRETLDKQSQTSTNQIHTLSIRQASVEQRQNFLEDSMTQMQKLQSETSKNIVDLNQELSDLIRRQESSSEEELLHKEKLAYLKDKKGLKKELCRLYSRHLALIPVPPLLKKLNASVDEFYMELNIFNDEVYERKSTMGVKTDEKIVKSYDDIFSIRNKRIENIYVLGNAGVGKTTWCLNFINAWLQSTEKKEETSSLHGTEKQGEQSSFQSTEKQEKQSSLQGTERQGEQSSLQGTEKQEQQSSSQGTEKQEKQSSLGGREKQVKQSTNENVLLEFDAVFFVSLRHASKEADLIEMIRNQIFIQTPDMLKIAKKVFMTEPEKCLVIVDGLDEWNPPDDHNSSPLGQEYPFPGRKDMNHCTVLTTTRPWKLNEIRPNYSAIDRAVIISGFKSKSDINVFAEKIFNKFKEISSLDVSSNVRNYIYVEDFVKEVKRQFHIPSCRDFRYLPDLMNIPIIVIFMFSKWFIDGSFEITMAGNYSTLIENFLDHEEGYRQLQPRYGKKSKYDGRLSSVPYLEEEKAKWSKYDAMLPDCLQKLPICVQYSGLILKLSKIAFEGLFESKSNTLIFSEEAILKKLTPEELEVSVKSGILSKSNVIGDWSSQMSKLSFLHKTVQEYMAAIYMVAHENETECNPFKKFKEYCNRYDKIYEMENVILFVCGLDTQFANNVLEHVSNVGKVRIKQNEHDKISTDLFLKCVKEFKREKTKESKPKLCVKESEREMSEVSMPKVSIVSIDINHQLHNFEDFNKLLQANVDNIQYAQIGMSKLHEVRQAKVLHWFSSNAFPNLTTLKLEHFRLQRSWKRLNIHLPNLRNLCLNNVSCKDSGKFIRNERGCVKLNFLDCINVEKVKMGVVTSCKVVLTGYKLQEMKFENLEFCIVKIRMGIQKTENNETKLSIAEGDKDTTANNNTYQKNNLIEIKDCQRSEVRLSYPFRNEQAYKQTHSVSTHVYTLHCKENSQCAIDVDPNIVIEAVSLVNVKTIPNIHWKKVKRVTLNVSTADKPLSEADLMVKKSTGAYIKLLKYSICCSKSLRSLYGIGLSQDLILELVKTVKRTHNIEALEIAIDGGTCNITTHSFDAQGIKHLKLHGTSIQWLEDISKTESNLKSLEYLQLSNISSTPKGLNHFMGLTKLLQNITTLVTEFNPDDTFLTQMNRKTVLCEEEIPRNALKSVTSFTNLKCLKCQGFSEGDFNMIRECFPCLPHLEELELSCLLWEEVEDHSLFSTLKDIKNLKSLSLVCLFQTVTSVIAKEFPNLGIEELTMVYSLLHADCDTSCTKIMTSIRNLKKLKKVTIKESNGHFAILNTIALKLTQIESLTVTVS